MLGSNLPPLSEWETFYVITGSAAAALTGLMFVVIALRTEAIVEGAEGGVRAWRPSRCASAVPRSRGLALSTWVVVQARRQSSYTPVLSDWIWHVAMPLVAYATAAAAAGVLLRWPAAALDMVAAAALLLLFIGIRNAWDAAVWIAAGRR